MASKFKAHARAREGLTQNALVVTKTSSGHIVMGVSRHGWDLRNRASASGEHVAADSAGCTSQAATH